LSEFCDLWIEKLTIRDFRTGKQRGIAAALELLFGGRTEPQRAAQIAMPKRNGESPSDEQLVVVARRGVLGGGYLGSNSSGRVASLWPPGLAAGEPATTAAAIIDLQWQRPRVRRAIDSDALETEAGPQANGCGNVGLSTLPICCIW